MDRRFFLKGLIVAATAPVIVRVQSLMPIVVPKVALDRSFWGFTHDDMEARRKLSALGIDDRILDGVASWSSSRIALEAHVREMAELRAQMTPLELQRRYIKQFERTLWTKHDREVEFLRGNMPKPIAADPIGDWASHVTGVSKHLLFGEA